MQLQQMIKSRLKNFLLIALAAVFLLTFFSYRLADVPGGITVDEAASGFNGALLARTLHDQNGRFLPVFVLSIHDTDWRTPYTQYSIALFFRLFGASVFNMRLTNVVVTVISTLLMFYLGHIIFGKKGAIISSLIFIATPALMIQTHLGVDPVWVLPFVLLWLIGLFKYKSTANNKYLVLAALSLGLGFYSYKGIRPPIIIWSLMSLAYISFLSWPVRQEFSRACKKVFKPLLIFSVTLFPFFAIIPLLDAHYAGAVFGNQSYIPSSIYSFFYYYLASFDPSFLFVQGDKLLVQSTGRHGMFLLASLPLFAFGLYQALRSGKDFFIFLAAAFFLSPLLFGLVGSAFFAHRLLFMVPFYCLFFTLGLLKLLENRHQMVKFGAFLVVMAIAVNFFDFWHYYIFDYPKDTYHLFYHLEDFQAPYQALYKQAEEKKLTPYLSRGFARLDGIDIGDPELFARAIYFPVLPKLLDESKEALPAGGILLSGAAGLPGLEKLNLNIPKASLYIH